MLKKIVKIVIAIALSFSAVLIPASATYADNTNTTINNINQNENVDTGNKCGGVNTSIINCEGEYREDDGKGGGIFGILLIVLNVLTFGIGIAGTLGIVIAGIMYLTARDNEAQVVKAKNMLINVIIGLAAYALLWAFLQWIIPGGVIGTTS